MIHLINKPATLRTLEFWTATAFYIFAVFLLITPAVGNDIATAPAPDRFLFEEAAIPFSYYRNYFIPQLVRYTVFYLAFLVLNFMVVPGFMNREAVPKNVLVIVLVFVVVGLIFGTTDTYLKNYLLTGYPTEQDAYAVIFQQSFLYAFWLLFLFGFYSALKYAGLHLVSRPESVQTRYHLIVQDGFAAFVLWMVSIFLLVVGNANRFVIMGWGIAIPFGILLYGFSCYNLIPTSLGKQRAFVTYAAKAAALLVISILPVFLLVLLFTNSPDAASVYSLLNVPFQLLLTVPLSWALFKHRVQGKQDLYVLKKELGQSHANLDFLRSQINPHFLFNALNTIYGTAIQEKAERTSEGIEKLGDMMRFMLQENMQEKISLAREIDYLNNYIGLQRLRTDPSPIVTIEAQIEQPVNAVQISPMLLIPFVENAFKHGISLREPSHIKVALELSAGTLYFDVYNSKHVKPGNDPEKSKSGIGLRNVKQRLQLLYPDRHELIIRETGKEFFVHLTMQLA